MLLICLALGFYGNATAVNILYSSRGIWSVVLVWLLGGWFGNSEREQGKEVMVRRLVGAFLLFLAIILVITTE